MVMKHDMGRVIVSISKDSALLTNPESEQGRLQNLLLNMMIGLKYEDMTNDEKALYDNAVNETKGD